MRDNAAAFGGDDAVLPRRALAGAYNAAMLALDPRWLGPDRAAVRGLVNELAGPFDFLPLDDPATIAAFGGWPRPEETQPVFHAGDDDPPALLLHGAADDRVELSQQRGAEGAARCGGRAARAHR